jgi:rhodanese-related sulfurtransferase
MIVNYLTDIILKNLKTGRIRITAKGVRKMKKYLYLYIIPVAALLAIVISACSAGTVEAPEVTSSPPATEKNPQATSDVSEPEPVLISGRIIEISNGAVLIRNEEDTSLYYNISTKSPVKYVEGVEGPLENDNVINARVILVDSESLPMEVELVEITDNVPPAYTVINAEKAKKMIDEGDVVILDVRTRAEYGEGHIADSYNVPLDEIDVGIDRIAPDKETVLLIYCRSGNRSKIAARTLAEQGYVNVYDLGGIMDWPYDIVTQ